MHLRFVVTVAFMAEKLQESARRNASRLCTMENETLNAAAETAANGKDGMIRLTIAEVTGRR
ncbi:hypothetical protein ASD31_09365 [Rhizobium sp. Root482]|nr:hypothetical protein ASD31_09365 [Rhizobium sp. Root482]